MRQKSRVENSSAARPMSVGGGRVGYRRQATQRVRAASLAAFHKLSPRGRAVKSAKEAVADKAVFVGRRAVRAAVSSHI